MPNQLKAPGFMQRVVPVSVKTWHWMIAQDMAPKRAELIRGVIIEKMSKSILHSQIASILARTLELLVGMTFWVRREDPITLKESEPEPDISVVIGRPQDYPSHPTTAKLVIEVSVSTLAEDREMADIYAEGCVEEYWLVNASERQVEIHRRPQDGHYSEKEIVPFTATISSQSLPEVALDLSVIFAGLPAAKA